MSNVPVMEDSDVIKLLESVLDDACRTLEITDTLKNAPPAVRDFWGARRSAQKKKATLREDKWRDF